MNSAAANSCSHLVAPPSSPSSCAPSSSSSSGSSKKFTNWICCQLPGWMADANDFSLHSLSQCRWQACLPLSTVHCPLSTLPLYLVPVYTVPSPTVQACTCPTVSWFLWGKWIFVIEFVSQPLSARWPWRCKGACLMTSHAVALTDLAVPNSIFLLAAFHSVSS